MRWADIAAAMEDLIPNAPIGYRPMFIQAVAEIRELRATILRRSEAFGLGMPIVTTYHGHELEGLYRDAMRWRAVAFPGDAPWIGR